MYYNRPGQWIALALFALLGTAVQAQVWQQLYYYGGANNATGGIYKDVQCLEAAGQNGEAIITVGSDSRAPANGLIAYHDNVGVPITYLTVNKAPAVILDAAAICNTPINNNVVACFYDPAARSTEVVCTNPQGVVNWTTTIPNFQVRDVTAGSVGLIAQERIWLTGNRSVAGVAPNVAVVGLTGAGAAVFYNEYQYAAPYNNTIGFEIDYNGFSQRLTVVGKTSVNQCLDGVLLLRLQNNGVFVWTNIYRDAACNLELRGKALVRKPGFANNYAVSFEYRDAAGGGTPLPGLLEIDPAGALVGATNFYTGAGAFFNGTNYVVDGMDTDGNDYLISGSLRNGNTGAPSGFSLNVDIAHASVQFNEYETAGAYVPGETKLVDLDYYAAAGQYVIGGHFIKAPATVWPMSSAVAFWLVATDPFGNSSCSTLDVPQDTPIQPNRYQPQPVTVARDGIDQAALVFNNPVPAYFDQCTAKRGGMELVEDVHTKPAFAYLEGQGQIMARVPAEVRGTLSLTLVDMQGRVLQRLDLPAGEHRIDVRDWAAGVYFLQFQGDGIAAGVQKVAIR